MMEEKDECINCGETIPKNKYYCSESCYTHANMDDFNIEDLPKNADKIWYRTIKELKKKKKNDSEERIKIIEKTRMEISDNIEKNFWKEAEKNDPKGWKSQISEVKEEWDKDMLNLNFKSTFEIACETGDFLGRSCMVFYSMGYAAAKIRDSEK